MSVITVGSLFSGIGGLDLGLERAGMTVKWQVEIDPYCRKILAKHWPDVKRYEDVHECGRHNLERVDVIAGGFPCQPVSDNGRKKAQDDARWLWPQFHRIIRELRPRFVLLENVAGLLRRGMGDVLADLAAIGFDAEWDCIPAAAFGACHLRERVFMVAYAAGEGLEGHVSASEIWRRGMPAKCSWWDTEPGIRRVDDGTASRTHRLRGLGNAVVPAVAEYVGRLIVAAWNR